MIRAPSYIVDYDGDGSAAVPLDGSDSHTHEPGRSIASWTWQEGSSPLGTEAMISPVLAVGRHDITLTIGDDKTPPDTLQDSATVHVYPITAVGGVLTTYHPGGTLTTRGPLGTRKSARHFTSMRSMPQSAARPIPATSSWSMTGNLQVPSTANYAFQPLAEPHGSFLWTARRSPDHETSLPVRHTIQARVSVGSLAVLPAEVLVSINGGAFAPPGAGTISHDETTLTPFVNAITPSSGAESGGDSVTITGIGFFTDGSGPITVNWGGVAMSGSALSVNATRNRDNTAHTPRHRSRSGFGDDSQGDQQ